MAPPTLEVSGRRALLVYLFPALGDAVLLAPIVKALLEAGAKPPIGLLLRAHPARIFKHVDLPVRVHVLPDRLVSRPEPDDDESVAEAIKLSVALQKPGYTVAADLTARDDVDARLWVDRSKAPIRLGYLFQGEGATEALTWGAPDERVQALEHWTRYLAAPLAPLALPPPSSEIPFTYTKSAEKRAEELFGPGPWVLLVPGARTVEKRFDPKTFAAAGRLAVARGGSVVVAGGPDEAELIRSVARAIDASASPYAQKALGPLVALATTADAVVTNDTGPMHLAFLSGRRTVAIFSTMSAPCWGPMRADPRFVVLTVPPGTREAIRPVVERLVLDHLTRHLDDWEATVR